MLLGGAALSAVPTGAMGCSAGLPSTAEVRDGARTIALVRVEAVEGDPAYPTGYTVDLIREIKGDLTDPADIPALKATICGDTISVLEGTRMVLARDVAFKGQTIAPYWIVEADDDISGGAGRVPAGGMSLDELIARLGGMPDTSAGDAHAGAAPQAAWPLVLVASCVLAGLWFVRRRDFASALSP
ncbi:MAG: hypothetical protein H0X20_02215 [Chloroflexi bacterium]|nr:hypothetical protein [Chloroflexota bacterium]